MNVQQLFYILGSIYLLLSLAFLIAIIVFVVLVIRKLMIAKRNWDRDMRNRKVMSSKTFKAVMPLLVSLGTSWCVKKLRDTLMNR